ncbi:hypothetical protein [Halomonas chromatireducens]|uniref:hypothetical protein n=1 Tax=Halomonas chromatireducens TaxID=507626 RepID=UPI001187424E|nr:hypothetical protein [Halomonas chromatireducens]
MSSIDALIDSTDEFFRRHWTSCIAHPTPEWKADWDWKGSVPHHDKRGVYALFDEAGKVIYVGLGASVGGGDRTGYGISRRLLAHVITTDKTRGRGHYVPQGKWSEVSSLAAIGFPNEYSYLAPALEDYLIERLAPPRNSSKRRKANVEAINA